jgi:PncC family amidohydrolase
MNGAPEWTRLLDLARRTGVVLSSRGMTLSTAESCTGGVLSGVLTEIAGASGYFVGGIIAYHNVVKTTWLGVPEQVLTRYGAVSEQTALAMAKACRKRFQTDVAISITGIAGPGGGTEAKPVGLVFLAVDQEHRAHAVERRFSGTRAEIRAHAVGEALELVTTAALS